MMINILPLSDLTFVAIKLLPFIDLFMPSKRLLYCMFLVNEHQLFMETMSDVSW